MKFTISMILPPPPRRMAVEGDLVLMKGDKPLTAWDTRPEDGKNSARASASPSLLTAEDNSGVNGSGGGGRNSGRGRGGGGRGGRGGRGKGSGARQQEGGPRQEVVRVTAEDAHAGAFSIKHVVLPLPGKQ